MCQLESFERRKTEFRQNSSIKSNESKIEVFYIVMEKNSSKSLKREIYLVVASVPLLSTLTIERKKIAKNNISIPFHFIWKKTIF